MLMQPNVDEGEPFDEFYYVIHTHEEVNHQPRLDQHDILYDLNNPQKMIEEYYKHEETPQPIQTCGERKAIILAPEFYDEDRQKDEDLLSREQEYEDNNQNQMLYVPEEAIHKKPPKQHKKYQELHELIQRMSFFNWSEYTTTSVKQMPMKNLTPITFWFLTSIQYFSKRNPVDLDAFYKLLQEITKLEVTTRVSCIDLVEEHKPVQENDEEEFNRFQEIVFGQLKLQPEVETPENQYKEIIKSNYDHEDNMFLLDVRKKLLELWRTLNKDDLLNMFVTTSDEPDPFEYVDDDNDEDYEDEDVKLEESDKPAQKQEIIDENQEPRERPDIDKSVCEEEQNKCEEGAYFRWGKLLHYLQKLPLETVEELYRQELDPLTQQNQLQLEELKQEITKEQSMPKLLQLQPVDKDELLIDLFGISQAEKDFMNYLESRQQQGDHLNQLMQSKRLRQNLSGTARGLSNGKVEDLICQICNDGDYMEENRVMLCTRCNIAVHQKCYGLETIVAEDWICELCSKVGPLGRFLRCPLCTRRGGAMKPTNIMINQNIFEYTNPQYHAYTVQQQKRRRSSVDDYEQNYPNLEQQGQLFYDFQVVQNVDTQNIIEPYVDRVWIHLTCAYWIPESFLGKDKQNFIQGIQNIDKKRFNFTCHVCKMKRAGACIQCSRGKCVIAFHPECARRAQLFMEPKPAPEQYVIYCEKHMPLKIKRIIDSKAKGYIEEIQNFCRVVEKVETILKTTGGEKQLKMLNNRIQQGGSSDKKRKVALRNQQLEIEAEIKQENIQLIKALRAYLASTNNISVFLKKEENGYQVTDVVLPLQKVSERNVMNLQSDHPLWDQFTYQSYTKDQIYKLYKRAIRMEKRTRTKKKNSSESKSKQMIDHHHDEELMRRRNRRSSSSSFAARKFKKIKKILKKIRKHRSNRPRRDLNNNRIKIVLPIDVRQELKEKTHNPGKSIQAQPVYDTTPYCICKQPFKEGENMMQCELCSEWYHLKCLGFTQGIEQASEINFYCFLCEKKVDKEKLRKVKQLYKHYFTDPTFKTLKNKAFKQKIQPPQTVIMIPESPEAIQYENIIKIPKPKSRQREEEESKLHNTRKHVIRNYKTFNALSTTESVQNNRLSIKKQVSKERQRKEALGSSQYKRDFVSTRLKNRGSGFKN